MKITDYRIRRLSSEMRGELLSFVQREKLVGMSPEQLMDVLDAYGRGDLAASALRAMELPVPTWEESEPEKLTILIVNEAYTNLWETSVEDRYTRKGKLSDEAARRLMADLSADA